MKKSTHSESKRRFLAGLASAGLVAPALLTDNLARAATAPPFEIRLAPKYYPRPNHVPEINLAGKVAIITGASHGIGPVPGMFNPRAGQPAFTGADGGSLQGSWGTSIVDLTGHARGGDRVRFRWDFSTDICFGTDSGWYVDNVRVYVCRP